MTQKKSTNTVRSVRGDDELHHEYDDESISDVGTLEVGVWCVGFRVGRGVEEFVVWYRGGSYICVDKNWETDTGKWWFGVVCRVFFGAMLILQKGMACCLLI